MRSQAYFNAASLAQRPLEMMIQNDGLAKIVNVGCATPETLNDEEWDRFGAYLFMQFNGWEYLYYQHRDRSIPKQLWVGADAYMTALVKAKPGMARFWAENHTSYDEPFRSHAAHEFSRHHAPTEPPTANNRGI